METPESDPGYDDDFENRAYEQAEDAGDQDAGPATTPEDHDRTQERDQAEG
ncbi:MAG TPA: hypothetical protein VM266_16360 [Solirubrobacteraceae bacterium]|nr:hypothetical protein [Solirubrobacteraceae bacterium]